MKMPVRRFALVALVVPVAAVVAGCNGVVMQNPLVRGQLQPNRVVFEYREAEEFRRVARGSFDFDAYLVSLDPQRICFDVTVKSLPDSQNPYDIRQAEINFAVDGTWQRENHPMVEAEAPVASYIPGRVPYFKRVEELDCVDRYKGTCVRHEWRTHRRKFWRMGDLEVLTSNARICYQNHQITAATKKVRLDVNIPMKPKEEQTLDDYMHGGAIRRLAYRWTFDPKGEGTPGAQMPATFVAGDPTAEPPNAHPIEGEDQPPQQPPAAQPPATTAPTATGSGDDLVAAITARRDLTRFLRYMKSSGLIDTLREPGPFTVCSAIDDAFARLPQNAQQAFETAPKERLALAFGRMIVRGSYPTAGMRPGRMERITTLDPSAQMSFGQRGDGSRKICDGATVIAEIPVRNGILYVTDSKH